MVYMYIIIPILHEVYSYNYIYRVWNYHFWTGEEIGVVLIIIMLCRYRGRVQGGGVG